MLFKLEDKELNHIIKNDPRLGEIIKQIGDYELKLNGNYFVSLVSAIVGQQLSMKAAETIFNRFKNLCHIVNPHHILSLSNESLREIGLSKQKISYVKDLAEKVENKIINIEELDQLTDLEIIQTLSQVKGIGEWTAQMFLIFTLGRLDVLPDKDLGIKKAIKLLYELEELPSKELIHEIGSKWEPYRSVASLCLWRALDRKLI